MKKALLVLVILLLFTFTLVLFATCPVIATPQRDGDLLSITMSSRHPAIVPEVDNGAGLMDTMIICAIMTWSQDTEMSAALSEIYDKNRLLQHSGIVPWTTSEVSTRYKLPV